MQTLGTSACCVSLKTVVERVHQGHFLPPLQALADLKLDLCCVLEYPQVHVVDALLEGR